MWRLSKLLFVATQTTKATGTYHCTGELRSDVMNRSVSGRFSVRNRTHLHRFCNITVCRWKSFEEHM